LTGLAEGMDGGKSVGSIGAGLKDEKAPKEKK
jgi:hypothetical protein